MPVCRVAIVVPALAASGGVSAVASFLYRAMADSERYEPHLLSLSMSSRDKSSVRLLAPASWLQGPRIEQGLWNGWSYQHFGAIGSELEFQRYQPRRQLTKELSSYDLIQVVAGSPAWAYTTRDLQKPVFLQVATLIQVERQALFRQTFGMRRLWLKAMSRIVGHFEVKALSHLSAVFVENTWMYEYLRQKMDPSRVVFAPPGVDVELFYPTRYQSDGYILCVGRLNDPRKNMPLLFRAYHRLRQILPETPPLILAGKSMPDSAAWQVAQSLGITDYIETLQNVSTEDLAELYRKASLFVLSSDEEGLGIVLLEAMASAIPVVATRCGGPETVIRDSETGYLVPKGDEIGRAHV